MTGPYEFEQVGTPFVVDPPSVAELKAFAADKRWRVETGGVTVGDGVRVKTDRESQSLIGNAVSLLNADAEMTSVEFKAGNGFVTIPRADMLMFGIAVGRFVQRKFAAERRISALIDAGEITSNDQIESWEGWNP